MPEATPGDTVKSEIYLDNNATTRPLPEVRAAMLDVLGDRFGNPSSAHSTGERARVALRKAREATAQLIGAEPETIVFTSSGTEANNMVWNSASRSALVEGGPHRIITTSVEHSSILKVAEHASPLGVEVIYLPVDRRGHTELAALEEALLPHTLLVSVQWVNNETGIIQPVEQIARLCRDRGIPFHTDAAQAVGKVEVDLRGSAISYLTLTGHKFHGPQGAGALFARDSGDLAPLFYGGPQEGGLRPGTENLPAIVGLGVAAELRRLRFSQTQRCLEELRNEFEQRILASVRGTQVNGDRTKRVSNTTNLLFDQVDGQALVAQLDRIGIRCSQSSACTNQRPEPSYVLRAMGLSEDEAYSSVRFSVSEENTANEIDRVAQQVGLLCEQLRRILPSAHAGR